MYVYITIITIKCSTHRSTVNESSILTCRQTADNRSIMQHHEEIKKQQHRQRSACFFTERGCKPISIHRDKLSICHDHRIQSDYCLHTINGTSSCDISKRLHGDRAG